MDGPSADKVAPRAPATMATPHGWDRVLRGVGIRRRLSIPFAELVWIHRRWRQALDDGDPNFAQLDAQYRSALALFEEEHGTIVNAYWCTGVDSAVALTEGRRRFGWFSRRIYRFFRVTDWASKRDADVARLLRRCDVIAIKGAEVLRGATHRICMQLVMASASHLLALVDTRTKTRGADGDGDDPAAEAAAATVREAELYYREMSARSGQIVYVGGMALGLLGVVAGAVGIWKLDYGGDQFLACAIAGAVGGIASVMLRMTSEDGKFEVDPELGRWSLRTFGAMRSVLGSVFGLTLYFALESQFINIDIGDDAQQAFVYALISFVGGFSERLAKDVIDSAEMTIAQAVAADVEPPAVVQAGADPQPQPPEKFQPTTT